MDHKHKLLATTSSEAQGTCPGSKIDRFSSLPDEVAHHILSFFNFEELVQVSSVSKRCRELYLSAPLLDFRLADSSYRKKQLDMLNSFERFLSLRGDNKIQKFKIHVELSAIYSDEMFRVLTWIRIAGWCNVEVLALQLRIIKNDMTSLELPSCIFISGSLRSLKVSSYAVLKVPSFTCSNNLRHISLMKVRIDEVFSQWISRSCKCVKELQLDGVRAEKITIESSSLESFRFVSPYSGIFYLNISGQKLEDINIEWSFSECGSRSLNIFAPNLKHLKWIGNFLKRQNLGKLMCLENAEILLQPRRDADYFENAFEFLCSICRVKVLILTEDTTKALCREGSMPASFNNISKLSMHIGSLNDDLVPPMASLLSGMPNLNTLCISTYPSLLLDKPKSCRFNRKYWISQNLGFVDKLKLVIIELSHGYNSWELARYILEHAENLEKMVIFYLPKQSYVTRRASKCKIVSNAAVIFREKLAEQKIRRDMWRYLYYISL